MRKFFTHNQGIPEKEAATATFRGSCYPHCLQLKALFYIPFILLSSSVVVYLLF